MDDEKALLFDAAAAALAAAAADLTLVFALTGDARDWGLAVACESLADACEAASDG